MLTLQLRHTMTALLLIIAAFSALQATGTLASFVLADGTVTIQLARVTLSTEPLSASGTVRVDLNSGLVTLQINEATPEATYIATFLATSPSATLELGALSTETNGSGALQAKLNSGSYAGVFQITRLGLVQYASVSTNFTINASSVTISQSSSINATAQVMLQVEPSSSTINAGSFAKFSVIVVENATGQVFLHAKGVPPASIAIFTPNAGVASPTLNSSLTIITSTATPLRAYTVTVVAIVNGAEYTSLISLQVLATTNSTATANTTISSSVSASLSMTLSTDEPRYEPNSTINIQGQVTDARGSAVAGATVSIQVDAPNGAQLFYTNRSQTNSAGLFQTEVNLTPTSPAGTYTVFASADKPDYANTTTRTTFVVGTSTTPSVIIRTVYAGDSAGNPTSSFTTGQTIWIWIVIQNIGTSFQGIVWIQVRGPNGVPVQIQIQIAHLNAGQTVTDGLGFTLPGHATSGVYTVNALVSDKLISQGGVFLASSETQFALIG